MSRPPETPATTLYPTTDPAARDARVDISDPVHGGRRAHVVARPVHLDRLETLVRATGTLTAVRERAAYAAWLTFGPSPQGVQDRLRETGRMTGVSEQALPEAERRIGRGPRRLDRCPHDVGPRLAADQPFQELPSVLMTPHVAGWTEGTFDARLIAETIQGTAQGGPPLNLIAPAG